MAKEYDFAGWATRANLKCSDGRVIMHDAFKENDGAVVPIVWNHQHNSVNDVLGHGILKNMGEGVRIYGKFNDTENGQTAKSLVKHGDVEYLSIWANQLRQNGSNVIHGNIREVSLVLAGANPGAYIDDVMAHADDAEFEGQIYTGMPIEIELEHADKKESMEEKADMSEEKKERTVGDVIDDMTEEQQKVLWALVKKALEEGKNQNESKNDEGGTVVKHNVFDNNNEQQQEDVIQHSDVVAVFNDIKKYGSLKESSLAHGIENVEYLFPDARTTSNNIDFISRNMDWVSVVMNGATHTAFSRIKSIYANITEDEARAKGYIKGNMKKEEVFTLLKRTTSPTSIYKKQKMDRDDMLDITDFNVAAMLKTEMRMMLDEEIARAALVGDGRSTSDDDHINTQCIRPIYNDEDLYTIKTKVTYSANATDDDKAKLVIRAAIKARKDYKGSGSPIMFTTEDMLTNMLLMTDTTGRDLYESEEKLARKLRVSRIVTVPVMENLTGKLGGTLVAIIVNMKDYTFGADKGGEVNMFDDFDIDYNQQKYLIETRCSGSLNKPYSAIAIEMAQA
jgi:hypothetical protein